MKDWSRNGLLTMAFVVFVICSACTAGDLPTAKIQIGEKMPDFTLPEAGGGRTHSLYEFQGKKAVAVIFIATQCPYSNAFNHVMAKLAREYADRGVAFVGINANKTEPSARVADHARAQNLGFLVLKDENNVIADRLGASVTPEVFLLDSTWTLRYHGALGNSAHPTTKAEEANDAEFRPALEAVLAGQSVAKAETKAFGCTIKRI
jgi:peroxiredoxin